MSQTDIFNVKVRNTRGSSEARRMRKRGEIPAILYGHGEESVSLSLVADQVHSLLRHGGKVIDLTGDLKESALVIDVQWDGLGTEILHLDLARVSKTEMVETTVPIELRGEAPGTREGGVVEHLLHEIEIQCRVSAIPEKIQVSINDLGLNGEIAVADLELPDGAKALLDPASVVVHCVEAVEAPEEEAVTGAVEPELIRREGAEEEGDTSDN